MKIGRMKHRVTFLKRGTVTDELGQERQSLKEVATVWADIAPTKGGEFYEAQKLREELTWKVYVRYLPDITADMLIRHKEKLFEIKSVIDYDFQHRMLQIMCTEYVEKGDETDGRTDCSDRD